jgi:outer membrane protein, multidrug efflux system
MRIEFRGKAVILSFCISAVMLSACTVGPDYKRPDVALPQHWANPAPKGRETHREFAHWWKIFEDQTLDWLIDKAISDNLDLKLAAARVAQARAVSRQTFASFGPEVNASGSYARYQDRLEVAEPYRAGPQREREGETIVDDQYQTGFDANWELDLFGGVRRRVEAGEAELDASTEARRDVLVTLAAEVARSYIELRVLQKRQAIAELHRKSQDHCVQLTHRQHESGFVSGLDESNARMQAAETAARIPLLEASEGQTIHKIGILLGTCPGALIEKLSPVAELPMVFPAVPVGVPAQLLRRRPDIRQAEAKIHAATARVGVAMADLYPKLTITGSISYLSNSLNTLYGGENLVWLFGPTAKWRLFDTGRSQAMVHIQEALEEQAVITYKQKVLSAMLEVEDALIALAKLEAHRQALANAVRASRESLQLAKRLYRAGETDFLRVLVAEQTLYDEEDAFVQSRGDVLIRLISLYKALGGGWDS